MKKGRSQGPPGLAAALLTLSVARAERSFVLGDLEEEFLSLARTRGLPRAKRWYWNQALRSAGVLFLARLSSGPEVRAAGAVLVGCAAAVASALVLGLGLGLVLTPPAEPPLRMLAIVVTICALVSSTCGGCAATWVAGARARSTRALVGLFVLAPEIVLTTRDLAAEAEPMALLPLVLAVAATCLGLGLGTRLGRYTHSTA